jgi:hypothetical protein
MAGSSHMCHVAHCPREKVVRATWLCSSVEHKVNIAPCESSTLGTLWGSSWAGGRSPPIADSRTSRSRCTCATHSRSATLPTASGGGSMVRTAIRPGTTMSGCSVVLHSRLRFPCFAPTCPRAGSGSDSSGGWISTQSSSLWIGALPPHPSLSATPNVRGV